MRSVEWNLSEKLLIVPATALMAGVVLAGCSSDPGQSEQSALPKVMEHAPHTPPSSYDTINTNTISTALKPKTDSTGFFVQDERYTTLKKQPDALGTDMTSEPSINLLRVTLGADSQLQYEMAPGVPNNEATKLLGSVAANDVLLRSAMKPDANSGTSVSSLNIRMYGPNSYSDAYPVFVANDVNEGGQNTMYFMLPGRQRDARTAVFTQKVADITGHEIQHAELGHGGKWLKSGEAERMDAACKVIRDEAVGDMQWKALSGLESMKRNAGREFAPAFDDVIRAIRNEKLQDMSFAHSDKAAQVENEQAGNCLLLHPRDVLFKAMEARGLSPTEFQKLLDTRNTTDPARLELAAHFNRWVDEWNSGLGEGDEYALAKESTYLSPPPSHEAVGHPQDDSQELSASLLNTALKHTEKFMVSFRSLPKKVRDAYKQVFGVAAGVMKRRHPDSVLNTQLDDVQRQIEAVN